MFTGEADKDPSGTQFDVPAGLTDVKILDYDETQFINFAPEAPHLQRVYVLGLSKQTTRDTLQDMLQ